MFFRSINPWVAGALIATCGATAASSLLLHHLPAAHGHAGKPPLENLVAHEVMRCANGQAVLRVGEFVSSLRDNQFGHLMAPMN